jgi:FixJ family two-component response regulator
LRARIGADERLGDADPDDEGVRGRVDPLSDKVGDARKRTSVAIVEDDASFRVSLRRLCDSLGFAATAFASGRAFLDMLDANGCRPDCLLVDLRMPEMTGLELHRILFARGVVVPTILVTAEDAPEVLARCSAAGLTVHLLKPIGADKLFATIEQVTGNASTTPEREVNA